MNSAKSIKKYDRIIIGAGAAGLYFAANCGVKQGLILEKSPCPGKKLLLSGGGQCNLTHNGSIKEFVNHYGENGRKIRSALYRGNNLLLMKFFTEQGLLLKERPDGKVFPESGQASQILNLLLELSVRNGWELKTETPFQTLSMGNDGLFIVNDTYIAREIIIAAGGCSYPATGSDGSVFPILEKLGLKMVPPKPALVPITVDQYPYGDLAGISFQDIRVQIGGHKIKSDLLFTHGSFSGPAILNLSRYANPGDTLCVSYLDPDRPLPDPARDRRMAATFFTEEYGLPKRFIEFILRRLAIDPAIKAASLSGRQRKELHQLLSEDTFSINGTSGFESAMATCGGVSLEEVDLKTFESIRHPGLFLIGEVLDIDGDTGGYNLQFAFSSAYCAARTVSQR